MKLQIYYDECANIQSGKQVVVSTLLSIQGLPGLNSGVLTHKISPYDVIR
jgi:hypothetical protein